MSAADRLNEIEARANAATGGPWGWRNTQDVYLMGARSRVVMAFERMGMQGAQPSFRRDDGCLYPAGKENINTFADAAFIAHARTDVPALVAALRAVLDLHRAHECTSSFADDDPCFIMHGGSCALSGTCRECHNNHPCLTARAIEESLS